MASSPGPRRRRLCRVARSAIAAFALGATSLVAVGCTDDASTGSTSVAATSTETDAVGPTTTDAVGPTTTATPPDASAPASTAPASTVPASTVPASTVPARTAPASTASTSVPAGGGAATTNAPADSMVVSTYFVRGEQVAPVHRTIDPTVATSRVALSELLAGPTGAEREIGFETGIPAGTELEAVSIRSDGIVMVELSPAFAEGGGSLSMQLRLAQVVFTLTQFATVTGVQLASDGEPIDVFGSEGIVLDEPLTRDDFEDLTPAILVEDPAPFDLVGNPLRVHGTANVFEAAFMVRLTDAAGNVVAEGPQMATSGTGTRGTFDLTIETVGATAGRAELRLWEASAQDGSDVNVVTIPLELTG